MMNKLDQNELIEFNETEFSNENKNDDFLSRCQLFHFNVLNMSE